MQLALHQQGLAAAFLDLSGKHRHFKLLLADPCSTLKGLKASLQAYKNTEFRPHSDCQEICCCVWADFTTCEETTMKFCCVILSFLNEKYCILCMTYLTTSLSIWKFSQEDKSRI